MSITIHNLRTPVDKSAAWYRVRAGMWDLRSRLGIICTIARKPDGWRVRLSEIETGMYESMDAAMLAAGKGYGYE